MTAKKKGPVKTTPAITVKDKTLDVYSVKGDVRIGTISAEAGGFCDEIVFEPAGYAMGKDELLEIAAEMEKFVDRPSSD